MSTLNALMDEIKDADVRIEKLHNALKKLLKLHKGEVEDDGTILATAEELVKPRKIYIHQIDYDFDEEDLEDGKPEVPESLEMEVEANLCSEDVEQVAGDYITSKTGWCHKSFNWYFM